MPNPQTGGWRINKENSIMDGVHKSCLLISLDHAGEIRILKNRWGTTNDIDLHLLLEVLTKSLRTRVIGCNIDNFNMFKSAIEEELKEEIMKVLSKYAVLEKKK
jgi:hypothetical protein